MVVFSDGVKRMSIDFVYYLQGVATIATVELARTPAESIPCL